MLRYKLRTLLIVLALGPPLLAFLWFICQSPEFAWLGCILATILSLVAIHAVLLTIGILLALVVYRAIQAIENLLGQTDE